MLSVFHLVQMLAKALDVAVLGNSERADGYCILEHREEGGSRIAREIRVRRRAESCDRYCGERWEDVSGSEDE